MKAARRAGWIGAGLLALLLLLQAGEARAAEEGAAAKGEGSRFSKLFHHQKKKKPPQPVEKLFDQAMSYYQGRETWFRRRLPFRINHRTGKPRSWAVRHNYPKAVKLFQDVITYYPYSKYAPLAELHIADCKFALENWEEAGPAYEDFIKLHPVHPEIPYAVFRLGRCHYQQRLKYYRDQTETKAALTQFQILENQYPKSPYVQEAAPLLEDCLKRLARHELYVGDFYFKHKRYWASAMRYAVIARDYPHLGFTDQALFQEAQSYDRLQRYPEAVERYQKVIAEAPDGRYAGPARDRLQALKVLP
jgi:outer membrane protein assembly factor BamD